MKELSGKFVIRVPVLLHRHLKTQAHTWGLSLNELCVKLLRGEHEAAAESRLVCPGVPKAFFESLLTRWQRDLCGIVLFGSAVRQELTPTSDVDLLLVLPRGTLPTREHYREWDNFFKQQRYQLTDPREWTAQFVTLPENAFEAGSLWYETAIEGRIMWERQQEVSSIYQKVRSLMATGMLQRHLSHGQPYWIKVNSK